MMITRCTCGHKHIDHDANGCILCVRCLNTPAELNLWNEAFQAWRTFARRHNYNHTYRQSFRTNFLDGYVRQGIHADPLK